MSLGPEGKGWRYVLIMLLIISSLFGVQTCSDSSWFIIGGGDKIIGRIVASLAIAVVLGFLYWVWLANRPKKK